MIDTRAIRTLRAGDFEPDEHFYPRVLNAQLHPLVRHFMTLGVERVAERYAHLNPATTRESIEKLLRTPARHFRWGGADLFLVTNESGVRQVVVIETNSCPSGQKSMPLMDDSDELGSYRRLIERTFIPQLEKAKRLPSGKLAVIYDKNPMEASGYAATIAELTGEEVLMAPSFATEDDPVIGFDDGILHVQHEGQRVPIRAALRYVTQRPWTRVPPLTKTHVMNPVLACLAGGRNKAVAAKAYDLFNAEARDDGLALRTPDTIWDVSHGEIPLWVTRMGGVAVIKDPYSNAGQGVWTITNEQELARFMQKEQRYTRFIVQGLIGNHEWSSRDDTGRRLYHVGTVPDKRMNIFASDLRFMVGSGPRGFYPVAMYARRARQPLSTAIDEGHSSWDMLGTNLSVRASNGEWSTQTERLLLFDNRDFNRLGIGVDDLIEAFIQTVMAVTAIDRMCTRLVTQKGVFRRKLFRQINPDPLLAEEITR